jgi:hypothetical protein
MFQVLEKKFKQPTGIVEATDKIFCLKIKEFLRRRDNFIFKDKKGFKMYLTTWKKNKKDTGVV